MDYNTQCILHSCGVTDPMCFPIHQIHCFLIYLRKWLLERLLSGSSFCPVKTNSSVALFVSPFPSWTPRGRSSFQLSKQVRWPIMFTFFTTQNFRIACFSICTRRYRVQVFHMTELENVSCEVCCETAMCDVEQLTLKWNVRRFLPGLLDFVLAPRLGLGSSTWS